MENDPDQKEETVQIRAQGINCRLMTEASKMKWLLASFQATNSLCSPANMSLRFQGDTSHYELRELGMKNRTKQGQKKGRPYTPKPKQARIIARHLSGQSDREIA